MCAYLHFAHRIHFFPLRYSDKRPAQSTQSASCSSSSVESSAKGTARSVFESYKVSDGAGSWRTLFSVFLKDQEELSKQAFSGLFDFLFLVCPTIFCKMNSLFSLLFLHDYLAVGSGLAQDWYLILGEPQQKLTAKNKRNWMVADRWYSLKQNGSQVQNMYPLRLEGARVVWRCFCHK